MDVRRELRLAFIALGYFTRVPIPAWVGWSEDDLNRASRYLPLVGVVVGAIAAVILMLGTTLWNSSIAVGLSMLTTVLVTGGFHEDGLADSVDGFGGGYTPDKVLTIMQDSRIGTFGALALVLILLLKFSALVALADAHTGLAALALVVAHTLSRIGPLWIMGWLPYARVDGVAKAKPVAEGIGADEWRIGTLIGFMPLLLAWWWSLMSLLQAVMCGLTLLLVAWAAARYFRRRIGGYTGDCLGATQQVAEISLYLVLCAAWL